MYEVPLSMSLMGFGMGTMCTKRIQPARGWCATVKRECANCIHLILPLRRPGPPVFFGSQSCDPASWLAERQLLVGDIESNPGPKPFYTHSLNPPHSIHTLIHQPTLSILPTLTFPCQLTHICPIPSAPSAKHTHIPLSIYSTAHTCIPQTTYWTSGCLPGGCCLC